MPTTDAQLESAVLQALHAQGLRDRLFRMLYPGLSALQVLGRIPDPMRQDLLSTDHREMIARRNALDRVSRALYTHIDTGKVDRTRHRLKSAMVDCFSLSRRRRFR
jgi:hypothetical protein